jgi:hypothetical protein
MKIAIAGTGYPGTRIMIGTENGGRSTPRWADEVIATCPS